MTTNADSPPEDAHDFDYGHPATRKGARRARPRLDRFARVTWAVAALGFAVSAIVRSRQSGEELLAGVFGVLALLALLAMARWPKQQEHPALGLALERPDHDPKDDKRIGSATREI